MENNKGNMMAVYVLIVILVLGFFVYITIKNKEPMPADSQLGQVSESTNNNMENSKQVEGVKITILKEGSGAAAKAGDTVAMNYTGMFTDGTSFDSSVDPKFGHVQPFVFTLGSGGVIKGWDLGIVGM